jgi:hypothetical protein
MKRWLYFCAMLLTAKLRHFLPAFRLARLRRTDINHRTRRSQMTQISADADD